MSVLEAIGLGVLQGATEFLPVSSSGHLTLAERGIGMEMDAGALALDVMLHAATLAALAVYFGRAWARRLRDEPRLAALALVACVPVAAAYVAGAQGVVVAAKRSLPAVGAAFALAGGFVAFASLFTARRAEGDVKSSLVAKGKRGLMQAALVGVAQGVALLPGVSRSGATIGTGLLTGLDREAAFEFSFLVGAPAIFGALILESRAVGLVLAASPGAALAGFAASFATGLAALVILRKALVRRKLWAFGAYTIGLGLLSLGLAIGGDS